MRSGRVYLGIVLAAAASACGGGSGSSSSATASSSGSAASSGGSASAGTATLTCERFENLAHEDHVAGDALRTDGRPDALFTAQLSGRVTALILTICDGPTSHSMTQWDTVVGQTALPTGFMHRLGYETWVLGVMGPDGRMLNRSDGSLREQNFEQPTTLRLFAGVQEPLQPGRTVCLTVLRPSGPATTATAEIAGATGLQ